MPYWTAIRGKPPPLWYAFSVSGWQLISLNSNTPLSGPQVQWLQHLIQTTPGYGNCRITNTRMPNCWRVVYYNSQDVVILNTVEVVELPDVAQAAKEDLDDSHERLTEVLAWVEGA